MYTFPQVYLIYFSFPVCLFVSMHLVFVYIYKKLITLINKNPKQFYN